MSEKKHELLLIFAALLICCFFFMYEFFDSPKYNSVEAVKITSSGQFHTETTTRSDDAVNINTASVEELCTLEGIGESKATAIIEYREKNGKFRSAEEIMQVNGISEILFSKNINRITV